MSAPTSPRPVRSTTTAVRTREPNRPSPVPGPPASSASWPLCVFASWRASPPPASCAIRTYRSQRNNTHSFAAGPVSPMLKWVRMRAVDSAWS